MNLKDLAKLLENLIDTSSLIIIFIGIIYYIVLLVSIPFSKNNKKKNIKFIEARIIIAEAITLSLTLILASDIVKSVHYSTFKDLGKLAIIIFLRQFTAYFLDREKRQLEKKM